MVLGQLTAQLDGRELGFVVNDRGVIDATSRYNTAEYMRGGPAAWTIGGALRVEAIVLHHWAGWYGPRLTEAAAPGDELAQLDACARDHRDRFGIGPAYNVIGFPSGRVWAVGKHGTHRAHTKGRRPEDRQPWNVVGRSVCIAGNYELEPVTPGVARAIRTGVEEVRSWPGVREGAPIHEHGLAPAVNSAGVRFSQATQCPGRHIGQWRADGGLNGETEPDRFGAGWAAAWSKGYGAGALYVAERYQIENIEAQAAAARIIANPPPAPPVPSGVK